jgi:hypothetical protein
LNALMGGAQGAYGQQAQALGQLGQDTAMAHQDFSRDTSNNLQWREQGYTEPWNQQNIRPSFSRGW